MIAFIIIITWFSLGFICGVLAEYIELRTVFKQRGVLITSAMLGVLAWIIFIVSIFFKIKLEGETLNYTDLVR